MKILVTCPCGRQMIAGDDLAGTYLECPACGEQLLFPVEVLQMDTGEPSVGKPSNSGSGALDGDPARPAAVPSFGSQRRDPVPVNHDRGAALFVYGVWG